MKERLDTLLVEKGFFPTREKARASIMSGVVFIDQQRFDKPGTRVDIEANINIKGDTCPYVSRGGLKLEKAMEEFSFDVKNKVCIADLLSGECVDVCDSGQSAFKNCFNDRKIQRWSVA